jgi:hypothetical protein
MYFMLRNPKPRKIKEDEIGYTNLVNNLREKISLWRS